MIEAIGHDRDRSTSIARPPCSQLRIFFKRLTIRLRSRDAAIEALHETFLRLDRMSDCTAVQSPKTYIFHAAVNIAKNRWKAETYRVGAAQVDALFDVPDEAPDQGRIVEARSEIDALKHALAELPPRRREILNAIAIEGLSAQDVAARLRVSLRTVETDLKHALDHCAARLDHKRIRRTGGPRPRF
jgi:RNA polymerase sigma-70 factor (ECF subfamily)